MNICPKLCDECPFSKNSMKGFLADYDTQDFIQMMNAEVSFPCHMSMPDVDSIEANETVGMIDNGDMKICRGYVESVIKSCKSPYHNKQLVEAVKLVKEQGLSDNSMSIFEFIKYHDQEMWETL